MKVPPVKALFIIFLVCVSCASARKFENVSLNSKYITYEKVRVNLNTAKLGELSVKGYISLMRDSLICFKLFGPMGLEILSGKLDNNFHFVDHYNDLKYDDVLQQLISKTGIVVNRKVIETLLLGDISGFKSTLVDLNGAVINFEEKFAKRKNEVAVINVARKNRLTLNFSLINFHLNKLIVSYSDTIDKWTVEIEILSMSNQQKKCNFD